MNRAINSERLNAFLKFLDSSPSPFHAVDCCKNVLEAAGFTRLCEAQSKWNLQRGGKYFFTRNGSSLVAFSVGEKFLGNSNKQNGDEGSFNIIAAHTDSPCLRVKPLSKRRPKDGFLQVAVETYGGGIWHTWFDRDLGVAGRVVVAHEDGSLSEKLVRLDGPILRIPTLAIHLDRSVNGEGFKFNTELQLLPIMATEAMDGKISDDAKTSSDDQMMHKGLKNALLHETGVQEAQADIVAVDLCLYDTQKASLGGIHEEFIHSARLDNLFMTFSGLCALIDATALSSKDSSTSTNVLVLYDNEEVGSLSSAGAESTLLASTMQRVCNELGTGNPSTSMSSIIAQSFLLSADMAHAVHPNYSDKHDECHRPRLHGGIVLKYNSNQRYTTNSRSAAFIKNLAKREGIPIQEFMVRNDSPCGTTIGPIVAAQLGLPAVDVGAPQLSMHSIREMAGVVDLDNSVKLFHSFYCCDRNALKPRVLDDVSP